MVRLNLADLAGASQQFEGLPFAELDGSRGLEVLDEAGIGKLVSVGPELVDQSFQRKALDLVVEDACLPQLDELLGLSCAEGGLPTGEVREKVDLPLVPVGIFKGEEHCRCQARTPRVFCKRIEFAVVNHASISCAQAVANVRITRFAETSASGGRDGRREDPRAPTLC